MTVLANYIRQPPSRMFDGAVPLTVIDYFYITFLSLTCFQFTGNNLIFIEEDKCNSRKQRSSRL
jgi:hypothetical protein